MREDEGARPRLRPFGWGGPIEERTNRDLKDIRQILKNALERLIEKKIGYYL
ncbi:MAG: hypothetical protein ACE5OO_08730 [Candidatus Bathyarchaeia archaeon]